MPNLVDDKIFNDILEKDVLELIGAQNLPDDKKRELYQKIADTVENRAVARIYSQLPKEDGQELDTLIDQGDSAKVDQFLQSKGINIISLLTQEAVIYKTEMVELFKSSSNTQQE